MSEDKLPLPVLIEMLRKAEKELCEFQGLKPGVLIRLVHKEIEKEKKIHAAKH